MAVTQMKGFDSPLPPKENTVEEFREGQKVRSRNGTEGVIVKVFENTEPVGDLLVSYVDAKGEKRARIVDPEEVRPV